MNINLNLGETERAQFPGERFNTTVLEEKFKFLETRVWMIPDGGLEEVLKAFDLVMHQSEAGATNSYYTSMNFGDRVQVVASTRGETVWFTVAANTKEILEKVWQALGVAEELTKKKRAIDAPTIRVDFWTVKNVFPRNIEAPKWKQVEDNYNTKVKGQLADLMAGRYRPSAAGQLMLWHGLPGTGKTYALRALGREWRKWAKLHYITDPDAFFGSAQYMLNVLLSDNRSPWESEMDELEEDSEASKKKKGDGWKVIIAEDTGELLAADAKQQTGQGLSRLLNIVDGMIGQGLRVMVLITTNEELRNLHPAVTRPGRCGSLIQFDSFSVSEQEEWLIKHGITDLKGDVKGRTIAELFALVEGRNGKAPKAERKMGFAG